MTMGVQVTKVPLLDVNASAHVVAAKVRDPVEVQAQPEDGGGYLPGGVVACLLAAGRTDG